MYGQGESASTLNRTAWQWQDPSILMLDLLLNNAMHGAGVRPREFVSEQLEAWL
jgi:hypothetical protein